MTELHRQPPTDFELEDAVHTMGAFFGIGNVETEIRAGGGWACGPTKTGIKIYIDPTQIAHHKVDQAQGTVSIEIKPQEIAYAAGHEIGHARDILDGGLPVSKSSMEHYFWNVTHDTVINTRMRSVPMLDQTTHGIYRDILFQPKDLTGHPKHIQLMEAILLRTVVPEGEWTFSDDINDIVDQLQSYQLPSDANVNILSVLTNRSTGTVDRVKIAKQFIWPLYEQLHKEDLQESKQQSNDPDKSDESGKQDPQNSGNEDGSGDPFADAYDDYEKQMHGESHDAHGDSNKDDGSNEKVSGKQSSKDDTNDEDNNEGAKATGNKSQEQNDNQNQSGSFSEQIAQAVVEQQAAHTNGNQSSIDQNESNESSSDNVSQQLGELAGNLAGKIREEMNLSKNEADSYVDILVRYRNVIVRCADVWLSIAAHTDIPSGPRYRNRHDYQGRRLHSTTMMNAAIQMQTRHRQAIWQPLETRQNRREYEFGGLDFTFLGDVSSSMAHYQKSEYSSTLSAILMESIELAIARSMAGENNYQRPDVRSQVYTFGSSFQALSELQPTTSPQQKGNVYHHLKNPKSGSTYIGKALDAFRDTALAFPERSHIGMILTDGVFSDSYHAAQTASALPENAELLQLSIMFQPDTLITPNNTLVTNPADLPTHLLKLLQNYRSKMDN